MISCGWVSLSSKFQFNTVFAIWVITGFGEKNCPGKYKTTNMHGLSPIDCPKFGIVLLSVFLVKLKLL